MFGGEEKFWSAAADIAGDALVVIAADLEREVGDDIAIVRGSIDCDGCSGWQGDVDVALFVFDFCWVGAGEAEFDAAITVFNVGFAVDLVELDVFGVGGDAHGADDLSGVEGFEGEGEVAGEAGQFHVGSGAVEVERLVGALDVDVAVVALNGDSAVEVGEGEVSAGAVDAEVTLDVVGGEVPVVAEVGVDVAFDGGGFEVAMLDCGIDVAGEAGNGDAAATAVDVD